MGFKTQVPDLLVAGLYFNLRVVSFVDRLIYTLVVAFVLVLRCLCQLCPRRLTNKIGKQFLVINENVIIITRQEYFVIRLFTSRLPSGGGHCCFG